jgi:hypothetical protein
LTDLPDSAAETIRRPQPGELWSLWDMHRLDAQALVDSISTLTKMRTAITSRRATNRADVEQKMAQPLVNEMRANLTKLRSSLPAAQADLAGMVAERLDKQLHNVTYDDFAQAVDDITSRLQDELTTRCVLVVAQENRKYFEPSEPLFGPMVHAKIEAARDDIDEAGKCLALQRPKATVCHLMLAMEHALRLLADKIGATVQNADGQFLPWLMIANNLEPKIKAMPEGDEKTKWWEAHSLLWSVGKAWRNPTMHPAANYTDDQAKRVFDSVRGFMQELAVLL